MEVVKVNLRSPEIGNKCLCIQEHGVYVLEQGPGIMVGISCTYGGSGTFTVYDGVPDDRGFFSVPKGQDPHTDHNGRVIWRSHPLYLGMNQLNAGFHHGLTIISQGSINPTLTITWLGLRKSAKSDPIPKKEIGRLTASGIQEVKVPSAPNSLTRSHLLQEPGVYRLARRDCELYTVNAIRTGLNVRVNLYNGIGRPLFSFPSGSQPSFCSDSFPVGGECEGGLIAELNGPAPTLALVWRERDQQLV